MKSTLFIISLLLVGFVAQSFLPWWSIVVVAAILSFGFNLTIGMSFLAGFLAAGFLWGGYAGYLSAANEGILAARVGKMLGGLRGVVLLIVTGILGGLFGGLGALTGSLGRQLLRNRRTSIKG